MAWSVVPDVELHIKRQLCPVPSGVVDSERGFRTWIQNDGLPNAKSEATNEADALRFRTVLQQRLERACFHPRVEMHVLSIHS